MYTEVDYAALVKEILSRIGVDLGVQFEEASAADSTSYPPGQWLYEIGSDMAVEVFRSGTGREQRRSVVGCHWSEDPKEFEQRFENQLKSAALRLMRSDEHDEDCPACKYNLRRKLNGVGVRVTDYRTACYQCGADVVGEFEHRVYRKNYCTACLSLPL